MGNLATGAFVVGAAAVGVGAYLVLTSRSGERAPAEASALRLVPTLTPSQTGLVLQGGF
jgi:hypothetical protein